jgi:hypothetical protein
MQTLVQVGVDRPGLAARLSRLRVDGDRSRRPPDTPPNGDTRISGVLNVDAELRDRRERVERSGFTPPIRGDC